MSVGQIWHANQCSWSCISQNQSMGKSTLSHMRTVIWNGTCKGGLRLFNSAVPYSASPGSCKSVCVEICIWFVWFPDIFFWKSIFTPLPPPNAEGNRSKWFKINTFATSKSVIFQHRSWWKSSQNWASEKDIRETEKLNTDLDAHRFAASGICWVTNGRI